MLFLPAIDLKEGRCVRLRQGRMDDATVFGDDPAAQATAWQAGGAPYLHLVDLDGAIDGAPRNLEAVRAILSAIDIPAELGGGIRDLARIEAYLSLGLDRVILGTAAARDPELVRKACAAFPGRIAVGIDARGGRVAVEGWQELAEVGPVELAKRLSAGGPAAAGGPAGRTELHAGTRLEPGPLAVAVVATGQEPVHAGPRGHAAKNAIRGTGNTAATPRRIAYQSG